MYDTLFIKTFVPADRHFTSEEEINIISNKLSLDSMVPEELRDLRNYVVGLWSSYEIEYSTMASITSVIDHVLCAKYGIL